MDEISKRGVMTVVGIDLAKTSFHLHGVGSRGRVVASKKLSRAKLARFMANSPPCLVGMEACAGAHYWARKFRQMGHEVRLIGAQFVKPYVKSNKNDAADAEAICEAVQRPAMRFVPVKTLEQQDIQCLHRARSMAVAHRTAQANQIRGFLAEYGVVVAKGIGNLRRALPELLEDGQSELTPMFRELLGELREELLRLDRRVADYDAHIAALSRQSEPCRRLMTIPGIGPLSATALVAAAGDVSVFRSGREMAAWVGLVPRQCSTGGKPKLLGISKRGDAYLRKLLIDGARAAARVAGNKSDRRSRWVTGLSERRGRNVAVVALANKNVRTAWALLSRGQDYTATAIG